MRNPETTGKLKVLNVLQLMPISTLEKWKCSLHINGQGKIYYFIQLEPCLIDIKR